VSGVRIQSLTPDTLLARRRIEFPMRRPSFRVLPIVFTLLFPLLLSATAGSFRGVIVHGPKNQPGWIWVKGAHSTLRKVEISGAQVVYDRAVPSSERQRPPQLSMKTGVEVRVTAEQDGHGEWRAIKVEILSVRASDRAIQTSEPDPDMFRTS
jgi:hypothetical protein